MVVATNIRIRACIPIYPHQNAGTVEHTCKPSTRGRVGGDRRQPTNLA